MILPLLAIVALVLIPLESSPAWRVCERNNLWIGIGR